LPADGCSAGHGGPKAYGSGCAITAGLTPLYLDLSAD
jgi:hypothetical protein